MPECSAQRYTCSGESACQEGSPISAEHTAEGERTGDTVPECLAESKGVSLCVRLHLYGASLVAEMVMNLPAVQETRI